MGWIERGWHAAATLLVSLIALTACSVPAWRAMHVEPIAAFRED